MSVILTNERRVTLLTPYENYDDHHAYHEDLFTNISSVTMTITMLLMTYATHMNTHTVMLCYKHN